MHEGFISVVIPLLTIVLAIVTKDVLISLLGGIFAGFLVLNNYSFSAAFIKSFDGIITTLSQGWVAKSIIFSILIGAIIELLERSGAIDSFVAYLDAKIKKLDSKIGAQILAYVIGVVIFIESSITSLVAGTVARTLFDKNKISRAKLAYICDSTSAPICSLVPLNAWGALLLGLLATAIESKVISGNATSLLISSIPYNFYSIITLIIVLFVILRGKDFSIMQRAKIYSYTKRANTNTKPALLPMLLPIVVMIIAVPIGLYISGKGDIFKGSGSTSIYYATIVTLIISYIYYLATKRLKHKEFVDGAFIGMGKMLQIAVILLLAIFIGKVISQLGTAKYLTSILSGNIPVMFIPALIFLTSSIIAFSTGTSWGTFSIMMPIALLLGANMHIAIPLVIGAVISGGIFGDHASPISDTTIISSLAAGCDHIEHVKTQLPYAILGAVFATVAFLIMGVLSQ